jgi:YidC/Oxa1 family membrane protein insertase
MYDRKTWIVLAVCGILLALGMYEQSKQATAERARQVQLAKQKEQELKDHPPAVPPAEAPPKPSLVVEPPPPPLDEELVTLESDQVIFTFSNIGGGIKFADFKTEFQVANPRERVRVNERGGGPIGGLAGAEQTLLNLSYAYDAAASVPGGKIVYTAKLDPGLVVTKTFALVKSGEPGAPYLLDFDLQLENAAATPLNLKQWSVFAGEAVPLYEAEVIQQTGVFWYENNSMSFNDAASFKGGWLPGSAEKSTITSPEGKKIQYAGVTNQFFATTIRPKEPLDATVWAKPSAVKLKSIRAGLGLPDVTLNPTEKKNLAYRIFIGPKHNPMLRKMGNGWEELMQYGWFGVVSNVLNRTLNFLHHYLDGMAKQWAWGLAIIFLTILVRGVIWPLHAKSTHTMKQMSKLQPEIAKLKEKYADDPAKLQTETMGLYRKFGINPLGGCLPMFIQIPIFFGFYRMLQYAVELRHQGFLWVNDLSQPDTLTYFMNVPINILPVVMAISSFLQIKMTPKTGDPTQQKIILFMPFIFFFFCYNFASALALYWTTQNIFSIGQTWLMSRVPEPELKPRKDGGKKSWMQRLAEQQAAVQKQRQQAAQTGTKGPTPDSQKKRPPRTGG